MYKHSSLYCHIVHFCKAKYARVFILGKYVQLSLLPSLVQQMGSCLLLVVKKLAMYKHSSLYCHIVHFCKAKYTRVFVPGSAYSFTITSATLLLVSHKDM
jgi:hypothetical protein